MHHSDLLYLLTCSAVFCFGIVPTMKICCVNIQRGLNKKIDSIELLLAEQKIDAIGLLETDLGPHDVPPFIKGFECTPDNSKRICLYVRDNFEYSCIPYDGNLPAIVISTKRFVVGFIYSQFTKQAYTSLRCRTTDKERTTNITDFLEWIEKSAEGRNILICGDYNIDWLSDSNSKKILKNWCRDHDVVQLIDGPTRSSSGSCLDLALSRAPGIPIKHSIFSPNFKTDHSGVLIHVDRMSCRKKPAPIIKTYKSWNFTMDLVQVARQSVPKLDTLSSPDDVNKAAQILTSWLQQLNSQVYGSFYS